MTGTERRPLLAPAALLPTGVVLGLLVLVWAATTGPVPMLRDSGRRYIFDHAQPPPATPSSSETSAGNLRELTHKVRPLADLSWLGDLLATALLLGFCLAILLAVRWAWRNRWHPPAPPEDVAFEVVPDRIAEALHDDLVAQLDAVQQGSPRNGIVACWLRLQEILSEAGVPPGRAETSAEFVVRTLHTLDVDPRPIATLAALFREARFSDHPIGEDARHSAQAALEALHEELEVRGAVR